MVPQVREQLRVVLVETRNPLNIGAAARAMHNFGFRHLRLVRPYDVAFREARSAVDAADLLATAMQYESIAEAVVDCTLVIGTSSAANREPQHLIERLEAGATRIEGAVQRGPAALLFGSEKYGLSNEHMSYCDWLIRIGTADSMNLGQAVAVCLYELTRDETALEAAPQRPAAAADTEQLTGLLGEILELSGYIHPVTAGSASLKLRRLVHRLNLSARDLRVWLGIFRQVLWKLTETRPSR